MKNALTMSTIGLEYHVDPSCHRSNLWVNFVLENKHENKFK